MNPAIPETWHPRIPIRALFAIALAALAGLYCAGVSARPESALALWAWGVAIFLSVYFSERPAGEHTGTPAVYIGGVALLLAGLGLFRFGEMNLGHFCVFAACVLYFGNFKLSALTAFPIFLWTVIAPGIEYAHFFISHPMRLIGAGLSTFMLSLAGIPAEAEGTIVTIGGKNVAVTSACSGVEQLEGMLFVAWLVAMYMHKPFARRITHFVFILPIILFANAVRLTVTLGGSETVSAIFLSDEVHTILGFATVVLILLLFFAVGTLFPSKDKSAV